MFKSTFLYFLEYVCVIYIIFLFLIYYTFCALKRRMRLQDIFYRLDCKSSKAGRKSWSSAEVWTEERREREKERETGMRGWFCRRRELYWIWGSRGGALSLFLSLWSVLTIIIKSTVAALDFHGANLHFGPWCCISLSGVADVRVQIELSKRWPGPRIKRREEWDDTNGTFGF